MRRGKLQLCFKTLYAGGSTWGGKKGVGYSMITTTTMIRNGVMTQQSCEQSDAHDVFFPSGFFVKQQQIQCQTPQTHQSSQNQQQNSHGIMPWMKRPMHQ